jgi:uncharacterized protein (UPF0248 family)
MMPIQVLLNRIRWDKEFGKGRFEIGYHDHLAQQIILIPFEHIRFAEGNHFSFRIQDQDGEVRNIPFHRVRIVYKDGMPIWHRTPSISKTNSPPARNDAACLT